MSYKTLIGIGFSSLGMSLCAASVDKDEYQILEYWKREADISELRSALNLYRGKSGLGLATSSDELGKLINQKISLKLLRQEEITINFAVAGGLIASVIHQRKFSASEESEILSTEVLAHDFLEKNTQESPAAEALKYGLGLLILLSQTKTMGATYTQGVPLQQIDAGSLPKNKFSQYQNQYRHFPPGQMSSWLDKL